MAHQIVHLGTAAVNPVYGTANYSNDELMGAFPQVGRTGAKTNVPWSAIFLFEAPTIPLGNVLVENSQVSLRGSTGAQGTGTLLADWQVLSRSARFDAFKTAYLQNDATMIYRPLGSGFQNGWALGSTGGDDAAIEYAIDTDLDQSNILTVVQSWTYNGAFPGHRLWFHQFWDLAMSLGGQTGSITIKVYNTAGSPGIYVKNPPPIDTLGPYSIATDFPSSTPVNWVKASAVGPVLVPGTVYATELEITGATPGNTAYLSVPINTTADGSVDNYTVYPNSRGMSGFSHRGVFIRGDELEGLSVQGGDLDVDMPLFTHNGLFQFGDFGGEDRNLPSLSQAVQDALRARTATDQRIAIRVQDFDGTTSGTVRLIQGAAGPTETLPGVGLFGPVLTISYVDPEDVPFPSISPWAQRRPTLGRRPHWFVFEVEADDDSDIRLMRIPWNTAVADVFLNVWQPLTVTGAGGTSARLEFENGGSPIVFWEDLGDPIESIGHYRGDLYPDDAVYLSSGPDWISLHVGVVPTGPVFQNVRAQVGLLMYRPEY